MYFHMKKMNNKNTLIAFQWLLASTLLLWLKTAKKTPSFFSRLPILLMTSPQLPLPFLLLHSQPQTVFV